MRVAILDLGVGNLHSLAKALERVGARVRVENAPDAALAADALVLPGVGAFGAAAARLRPAAEEVRERVAGGLPCLGICLGMQLLFAASEEGAGPPGSVGDAAGLGLLRGRVRRLAARPLPHMGWNDVAIARADPLLAGLDPLLAYFAHSFVAVPDDPSVVVAWSRHGAASFPSVVRRGSAWGVQFHPEKSGGAGLKLLANFLVAAAGESGVPS